MRFAEKVCAQARVASPGGPSSSSRILWETEIVPSGFLGLFKPPFDNISRDSCRRAGSDPFFSERKMLERLTWILLAWVLAFAFAPYFYALADL